jgi:hypothetical protein
MKKNIFFKPIILLAFFITSTPTVYAQYIDSLLNELDTKYPQEKIYLHFDRSYYNPGETIWFKAYITTGNLPSAISKTLYVELMDANGNILQRKIIPILKAGSASGFDLPDSLSSSLLYVKAYTAWMLNFDSTLLYIKPIHIIKPVPKVKKPVPAISYYLKFFPEGGDLVSGLSSRVAFKATDQYGIPVDVSGVIIDGTNNKLVSFSSVHDGMGYFVFTPFADIKYKAQWKDKKGFLHNIDLPEVKKQGVVLSINNKDNQVMYALSRPDSVNEAFTSYYVIAQMQQQLVYSAKINLSYRTMINTSIPTDSLPDGIMQVTVFNANEIPVAERIIFIDHDNYYFNTDLHAVEKNLDKRGHNALQVDVGGNLYSSLSISVTDADLNPRTSNEENIFSSLLLSSDLKGYVYDPAYYFSSDEDSVKQQLDLVMMTNGWRRFKWEKILAGQWPIIKYQPDNYISIQGQIFGLPTNLLIGKELNGILKIKNTKVQMLSIPVTKDGNFKIDNLYFYDTATLFYQFNNDKDKDLTSTASFNFLSSFITPLRLPVNSLNPPQMPDSIALHKNIAAVGLLHQNLYEGNNIKLLGTVTVTAKVKTEEEKMNEEYTSGFFSSGDAHTFILGNDLSSASAMNLLNYLQGKVAGLQISIDGSGNASLSWRGSTPSFFLDEVNSDVNTVQTIPMSDIAMVKVFPPPFVGAFGGGEGGAIAVYTKKGGHDNPLFKGLDFVSIAGYSPIKEFYSPDYSKSSNDNITDYRSTLYWNPFVIFDNKIRRITIPFYNSDKCKKIRIIIEGMNEAGQLTREEKIIE